MSIDSPAVIAIIGAGPIGLEAALYGRFLGYDVQVYEAKSIAHRYSDSQCPSPPPAFSECSSSLGWAAISAQSEDSEVPNQDHRPTCEEWLELYGHPLATTDLLRGRINEAEKVTRVARIAHSSEDASGDLEQQDEFEDGLDDEEGSQALAATGRFELQLQREDEMTIEQSDVVIDASGIGGAEFELVEITFERDADGAPVGVSPWDKDATSLNQRIVLPAERYFVIGRKRFGQRDDFTLVDGFAQVQQLFSYLGDRSNLDLYAQFRAQQG